MNVKCMNNLQIICIMNIVEKNRERSILYLQKKKKTNSEV